MRPAVFVLAFLLVAPWASALPVARIPPMPAEPTSPISCDATAATSGAGDAVFPDLTWAAVKTGFRLVVAWTTPEPSLAQVRVSVGDSAFLLRDPIERRAHAFVLDELPIGRVLCFEPATQGATGGTHAVRLANAMHAREPDGRYTINLLVLGTEAGNDIAQLEAAHAEASSRLRDATDGHVELGRVVTLVGDPTNHDSGLVTCGYALLLVEGRAPSCDRVFDVIWTYETNPAQAAGTNLDAISKRHLPIYMNNVWEVALASGTPQEAGGTLAHEMGHYAFGMVDLYGGVPCEDARFRISLMADSRTATEFDDGFARCPGRSASSGYVPSWTYLRQRFHAIPDRPAGPLFGPVGVGASYAHTTFLFADVPQVDQPWPIRLP